jgi:hypothetical protein
MIRETAFELRIMWRSFVLPLMLVLVAVLAVANAMNAADSVRSDYVQVEHTRTEYAANGMDFMADLKRSPDVTTEGGDQSIGNLARYDYDVAANAIVAISPTSAVDEALKYFGFLIYPLLFFLLGLWSATSQRRYRLEKVTLVRAGSARTTAARQLALLAAAAIIIGITLIADVVTRSIEYSILAGQIPFDVFRPLTAAPVANPAAQWGVILLVALFFGGGGIAAGAITGVFAIPALVFLAWDLVIPIVWVHDPRNWFAVLGHAVFTYSPSFQLAQPVPLALPIALAAGTASAVVLLALGYVGIRLRNPRAV